MRFVYALACGLALLSSAASAQTPPPTQPAAPPAASADELVGLWKAKKRFGPDARGPLIIQKDGAAYIADMMGRSMPVRMDQGELTFDLPDNQGMFRGKFKAKNILGHWFRPGTLVNGSPFTSPVAASPVLLKPDGPDRWSGIVVPMQDEFTFYLMVEKRPDGSVGILLRNPERDFGNLIGVERLTREGTVVKLIGKRRGQKEDRELATGTFDPANQVLTLFFLSRGLSYDFMREGDESDFYSRGKNPGRYSYRPPLARDDGWPTGTLEEANIDRAAIEKLIQMIGETPETTVDTPQIHGILIARHGKLVLEEYFHGFSRDMLHNTRSASKSVAATLVGAAMQAGAPLELLSPVYQIMNGGTFPPALEPQKRTMTLENLLTMSSGFFCDDNNEDAPGRENLMWEQTEERDFYRLYMKLPLDRKPGEKAVYCGGDPNLALGMVGRATGESPLYTFDRLIGGPMKIDHYAWPLDRARNPYGGGGTNFVLRDFMKFGQLMLNGGTWQGRRILSRDFVARASSPLKTIGSRKYGYLWWGIDYLYRERKVYAFAALGAGGQNVMVIPELDLVLASFSGSYATRAYRRFSDELIPQNILPAVREKGRR
ncbi:MAG: serine hydrolase [Pyrinomonadaceae bacterium]|nr:serine hydrolase [Pyrinomonadaceae bacterium]